MDDQGDDASARASARVVLRGNSLAHRMPADTLMCRMSHHELCEDLAADGPSRA